LEVSDDSTSYFSKELIWFWWLCNCFASSSFLFSISDFKVWFSAKTYENFSDKSIFSNSKLFCNCVRWAFDSRNRVNSS